MATKLKNSEADTLELYRVALENVETQSEIAAVMSELGYTTEIIAQGKAFLAETRQAYNDNKVEDDETSEAYNNFSNLKDQLADTYSLHRKKAKVIFRNDPVIMGKLEITGSLTRTYIKWLESAKKFYSVATVDSAIQTSLSRLRITVEELNATNDTIAELETLRAEYLKEKGESQDATKIKDAAFAKMDDWMSEFYAVAKIALEDSPQLLEALGKTVKS